MGQPMYQQVNLFPQNEYVKRGTFIYFEQTSPFSEINMVIDCTAIPPQTLPAPHSLTHPWFQMDSVEFPKQRNSESGGDSSSPFTGGDQRPLHLLYKFNT